MKRQGTRWAILLCATTLLTAAFFPVRAGGLTGEPHQARSYRAKLAELWQVAAGGGTGHRSFSEHEINAHLAALLAETPDVRRARGATVGIEDLRFDILDEEACLFVTGRFLKLPFVLEYRMAGAEGDAAARIGSVRLGHLPLIPPFKGLAIDHLEQLTGGMRAERAILERLTGFEVGEDSVRVAVGKRAAKAAR